MEAIWTYTHATNTLLLSDCGTLVLLRVLLLARPENSTSFMSRFILASLTNSVDSFGFFSNIEASEFVLGDLFLFREDLDDLVRFEDSLGIDLLSGDVLLGTLKSLLRSFSGL